MDKKEGAMDWMLTDEEIQEVEALVATRTGFESPSRYLRELRSAIARAAARKVVWEDGWCEEHIPPRRGIPMLRSEQRRVCEECQAALRQEVGL